MDALALLCTLHADGPTTLARLRQAECNSLEHVIAHPTERVARWMRVSVVSAERFQREARGLYERLGPDLQSRVDEIEERDVHEEREGDRDAGFDRERARAISLAHASSHASANSDSKSTPRVPLPPLGPSGTSERDPILQRVLDTWRERDELDAMTDSDVDDVPAALPVSAAERPAIGTQWIDGLDSEASATLSRAGVGTLEDLATCEALGIARATGMAYSRVLRFRALARRLVAARTATEEKLSPSERPNEPRAVLVTGALETPPAAAAKGESAPRTPRVVVPPSRDEGVGGPFA